MGKTKNIIIKIIIIHIIIYVMLGSTCSVFAAKRNYDEACGEFLAQYTIDFINKYCADESKTEYGVCKPGCWDPFDDSNYWKSGVMGEGIFKCDCTRGMVYMYGKALNVDIGPFNYDFTGGSCSAMMSDTTHWKTITSESDLKPGDILYTNNPAHGHAEMYLDASTHANFGNSPHSGKIDNESGFEGSFTVAFRLASTVEVDPSGKVSDTKTKAAAGPQIDYSNFFFNGIPDGKYSLASRDSLWDIIVEALKGMLDYFVGYLTYVIRIIIVGITSLFDKLLNNAVQSLNNAVPKSLIESGVTATVVQDDESEDRAVTIESLVFDQLELLDVNIFE